MLPPATAIKLGALHPTRDLLFVQDTVNGFVEIAKSDQCIGEEINIASNSEISVGDLASRIISMINPKATIIIDQTRIRPEKSEVERLFGSDAKITSLTSWRKEFSLEAGLRKTIDWFSEPAHLARYKAGMYNV